MARRVIEPPSRFVLGQLPAITGPKPRAIGPVPQDLQYEAIGLYLAQVAKYQQPRVGFRGQIDQIGDVAVINESIETGVLVENLFQNEFISLDRLGLKARVQQISRGSIIEFIGVGCAECLTIQKLEGGLLILLVDETESGVDTVVTVGSAVVTDSNAKVCSVTQRKFIQDIKLPAIPIGTAIEINRVGSSNVV